MPWELILCRNSIESDEPLGSRDDVIAQLHKSLPGIEFEDKHEWSPEALASMSDYAREICLRDRIEATYECTVSDVALEISGPDLPQVSHLLVDVHGSGNPIPMLKQLVDSTGWSIWDPMENVAVDVFAKRSNAWQRFRRWCIRAIKRTS